MGVVFFVLVVVPILLVVVVALWQIGSATRTQSWQTTNGRIDATTVEWVSSKDHSHWAIEVIYSFDAADRVYTAQRVGGTVNDVWKELVGIGTKEDQARKEAARRYPIGTPIVVRYNPRDPTLSSPVLPKA